MIRSLQVLVLLFVSLVLVANNSLAQSIERRVPLEFQGLNAFTSADVLKDFGDLGLKILKDKKPSQNTINEAAKALKNILAGRGYMDASVVGMRTEGSNQVRFVVDEGMQYSITSLTFVGNKHFTSDELTSRLREFLSKVSGQTRTEYDREILDYGIHTLANHMRSQGYLQARLDQPRIRVVGAGLAVTIPTTEGPLYRLGDLKIQGVESMSLAEVRSFFPLTKGDVADGNKIGDWLFEDLKHVYGEKGFIEYTAEPVPHFKDDPRNPGEGTVDLDVHIEEGKRFTLRSLTIEGEDLSEKQRSEFFAFQVGDFFNQRLLEESVARINKAGLFEPIDADKDLKFNTDQENATVSLVLNLKKRANADKH
jgi:outer membrane protein insertion porin family